MKFSAITALVALAAGVSAWSNETVHYTTEVVTAYTTYCPGPTQITHGSVTYTVTSATTLTITNCPCTVTKPVSSAVVTKCTTCAAPTSKPYYNSTYVPPAGTGAPPSKTSAPPAFTGAANSVAAGAGAGLAAVFGIAAYLL